MTAAAGGVDVVCVALGTPGDVLPLAHLLSLAIGRLPPPAPLYAILHCAEIGTIAYPSLPLPLPVMPPAAPPEGSTSARTAELDVIVEAIRGLAGGAGDAAAAALPRLVLINHWSAGAVHAADALGIPWAVLSAGPPPSRHAPAAAAAIDALMAADAGLRDWVAYNDHDDDEHHDGHGDSDDGRVGPMAAYMRHWMAPLYHPDYGHWRREHGLRPQLLPPAPPLPPVVYACSAALGGPHGERWGGREARRNSVAASAGTPPTARVEVVGCAGSCPEHTLAAHDGDSGGSGGYIVQQTTGASSTATQAVDDASRLAAASNGTRPAACAEQDVSGHKRHHSAVSTMACDTTQIAAPASGPAAGLSASGDAGPTAAKRRRVDDGVVLEAVDRFPSVAGATCPFGGVPADVEMLLSAARGPQQQQRTSRCSTDGAASTAATAPSAASSTAAASSTVATASAVEAAAPSLRMPIILLTLGSMPHLGMSPLTDAQWAIVARGAAEALGGLVLLQGPVDETPTSARTRPAADGASSAAAVDGEAPLAPAVIAATAPGRVIMVHGPVCHSALLRQCDAVVHHGGAGITHTATALGLPQVVVPMAFDQHDWAASLVDAASGGCAVVVELQAVLAHSDGDASGGSGGSDGTEAPPAAVAAVADALVAALRRVLAPPASRAGSLLPPLAARLRQEARDAPGRLAAILQRLLGP